jgi:dihydroflavonol-4-reductase
MLLGFPDPLTFSLLHSLMNEHSFFVRFSVRILVTGATGLLGGSVVRQLIGRGHEVVGLVRDRSKAYPLQGLSWQEGDLESLSVWQGQLKECQAVVHCAAYFREYYGRGEHWTPLLRLNVEAPLQLLEAARSAGVAHFVHISSSGTLHAAGAGSVNEASQGNPDDEPNLYFRSKILADRAIAAWPHHDQIRVTTILPGWMFGPHDTAPTASGRLVHDFLKGRLPAVPPGGTGVVDSRDVAAAIAAALESPTCHSRYVVAGRSTTLAELTKGLEKVSGRPAPKLHLPYWLAMLLALVIETVSAWLGKDALMSREGIRSLQHRHQFDSSLAKEDLGVRFRPLEETLGDCATWWRSIS